MSKIFRKVSLERLSSPEQLDKLMKVTTPKSWIALIGLLAMIFIVVLWGIFGRIPTKIQGQGILIQSGGLLTVRHVTSGRISDIKVVSGDFVRKGEVIARIEKPDLMNQIQEANINLNELKERREQVREFNTQNMKIQQEYITQQEENINSDIEDLRAEVRRLNKKIETQEMLYQEGAITKEVLISTEQRVNDVQREIARKKNQLKKIESDKLELEEQQKQELIQITQSIEETDRKLKRLKEQLNFYSQVVSSHTGVITGVMVNRGALITAGTRIANIEPRGKDIKNLEADIYVPISKGKEISRGMEIQISPSTVMKEEYGLMLGRVTYVSEYPATREAVIKDLNNENLVNSLIGRQAVIKVKAELIPSSQTESGYRWTSKGGPPEQIKSGTLATGMIITEEKRPISLVIPIFKSKLGL
ncbi:MAG: NHLP bacteriocin system secretion protein [Bacillota bacterium]